MKKRLRNVILAIASLCMLIGCGQRDQRIHFTWKGKDVTKAEITGEVHQEIDLSPKALKLKAIDQDKKDITNKLTYHNIRFDKVGKQKVIYQLKDNDKDEFTLVVNIKDTQAPLISGETSMSINVGDAFDASAQARGITANDNYDKEVEVKMKGDYDVNTAGDYKLFYYAQDSSKNKAQLEFILHVEEKKVEASSSANANATNRSGNSGIEYVNGFANPATINPITVSDPNSLTVLVNKYHQLPDGWSPSDLTTVTSNNGQTHYMRSEAASSWERMNQAAQGEGITLRIVSSYRTQQYQYNLYHRYLSQNAGDAYQYSAYPRRSEHELGLAIDISYDGSLPYDLHQTPQGIWLDAHAHEYGFIMRYPASKESITQYGFEPWHYRYVGVELASALRASGLTMEEYFNQP